jgi:hypothetical protein
LAPINLGLALGAHGGHVYEIFSRSVPEKAARIDDRRRSFALRRGDTPRLPTTLTSGDLSTRRVNPDLALVALDPLVLLRTSLGLVADAATDDGDQRSEEGKLRHRQKKKPAIAGRGTSTVRLQVSIQHTTRQVGIGADATSGRSRGQEAALAADLQSSCASQSCMHVPHNRNECDLTLRNLMPCEPAK